MAQTHPTDATVQETVQDPERAIDATQENLDKVRDILFGAQLRRQDVRWQELEEKLAKQLSEINEETRKRLDALEGFAKKEIDSVLELLKAESAQRADTLGGLANQLKEMTAAIEKRISGIDEQHTNAERTLRGELLAQSKGLRDEMAAMGQAFNGILEKTSAELRHGKTDRAALSGLLSEMAQRLNA